MAFGQAAKRAGRTLGMTAAVVGALSISAMQETAYAQRGGMGGGFHGGMGGGFHGGMGGGFHGGMGFRGGFRHDGFRHDGFRRFHRFGFFPGFGIGLGLGALYGYGWPGYYYPPTHTTVIHMIRTTEVEADTRTTEVEADTRTTEVEADTTEPETHTEAEADTTEPDTRTTEAEADTEARSFIERRNGLTGSAAVD